MWFAERRLLRSLCKALALMTCWGVAAGTLWAGNPRWVTGLPYFNNEGQPVVWYTNQPLYFTDPGDLNSSVNHAAADAIVAAAGGGGTCLRPAWCRVMEEGWYSVSSVSGSLFKRLQGNPVTGIDTSETGSMGAANGHFEGYYELTRIPMLPGDWQNVILDIEGGQSAAYGAIFCWAVSVEHSRAVGV